MKKMLSVVVLGLSCLAMPSWAEVVNINTASATSLADNLYGIGDKKAAAIVAYRKQHGDFQNLEQIKDVKGIGDGLFEKNKQDMTLTKRTATRSKASSKVSKSSSSNVKSLKSNVKLKDKPQNKSSRSNKDKKVELHQASPKDSS